MLFTGSVVGTARQAVMLEGWCTWRCFGRGAVGPEHVMTEHGEGARPQTGPKPTFECLLPGGWTRYIKLVEGLPWWFSGWGSMLLVREAYVRSPGVSHVLQLRPSTVKSNNNNWLRQCSKHQIINSLVNKEGKPRKQLVAVAWLRTMVKSIWPKMPLKHISKRWHRK